MFKRENTDVMSESRRVISVLGKFPDCSAHPEAPAIVILEKTPFGGEENARKVSETFSKVKICLIILSNLCQILTGDTKLVATMRNEIYHKYDCHIAPSDCNVSKASLIYPATPKHIRKHESSPRHLVYETPAMYKALTLPYLQGEKFDMQWIYNVLSHKQEAETIVYEDTDCDDGFVLLPDYKVLGQTILYQTSCTH